MLLLSGCATVEQNPDAVPPAEIASPATENTLPKPWKSGSSEPTGPLSAIGTANTTRPSVVTLAAPSDLWDRIRRGLSMPDLDTDLVRGREKWYASRPDYIQRMTERSSRYLFHIVEEIERRNMPMELALLPFIESAFNPQAVSSARAAGIWQFMPATGESFDLKQNVFRDDRRDVLASTRAALDYLQQLHNRFGDWHLALAAYNWGQGNVNRAITHNKRKGLPTAYTDLNMPLETRMYIPKLQAVKNIIAKPEAFGTQLPLIGNHPFFDTVVLDRDIDVSVIARLAGISEQDFRALNPSLRHPVVMAAGTPNILLPWDSAAIFQRELQTHSGPLATWTAWVVPTTMTAEKAAERVGMDARELRSINSIPPRMLVRAGSSLIVPRNSHRNSDVTLHVADNGHLSLQPDVVLRRVSVRARQGENLAALANRYGVSPVGAADWNKLAVNARLKSGQRITLMLPRQSSGTVASAPRKKGRDTAPSTSSRKTAVNNTKSVKSPQTAQQNGSKTKVAANAK
ncbi:MAG: transglycosylase SLT domain-containing protein [Hydrogenophaga sp.]|uniref:transglycosylase SLT domain-containing protein n=1 Tax=Hydrogenophaga sp. TaxID=1904254 RepID=UPI002771F568|nr:transglycosylase SLT domain-containing protein [Hydrogenophaga sp.]MDP2417863.1 transglycosylase SLT domain-containing protein [Hydrogenophaga sp.]MDZ4188826.1 transglycosylase SLT domain-containing protein [Hydrogenophaga sp.]